MGDSLRAFLFTDIEQSTRTWEDHELAMRDALARHDDLLRAAVVSHGGVVFSTAGDGLAAAFGSSTAAVGAAVAALSAFHAETWSVPGGLAARMGIHMGEAHGRDGDWFGPTVNRAARLMAIAHGGQLVVSEAVAVAVQGQLMQGVELADLGVHRLRDLSRPERVWQVVVAGLPADFAPLRSLPTSAGTLPVQLSVCFGREGDLARLVDLVGRKRVVVLAGPGGVGKTRLAIELAALVADRFPGGTSLIDLSVLDDPRGLDGLVATALGLTPAGTSARQAIVDAIGQRRMLLLVDNAEHLIDPVRDLLGDLTAACPSAAVVITSREPPGIDGEQIWPVRPLQLDDACGLFADRAQLASPDARLDAALVSRICERLDGIPLAIELAAARVRSLSLADIADRLDARFALLTSGRRGAVERHRTLRAAIDWSYRLLGHDESVVLRRLGIFPSSFDLDAAASVAGYGAIDPEDMLDLLDSLVAKSMLVPHTGVGATRYRLLESLRQYALEQLEPDTAEVADRHAAYFAGIASAHGGERFWLEPERSAAILWSEIDNLRSALGYGLAARDADLAIRLTTPLMTLWFERLLAEPGHWVAAAADLATEMAHPEAVVAHGHAAMAATLRFDEAAYVHHLAKAEGTWQYHYAHVLMRQPTPDQIAFHFAEATRLAAANDPSSVLAIEYLHVLRGIVAGLDVEREHEHLRNNYERVAGTRGRACLRMIDGMIALRSGRRDDALACYAECIEDAQSVGLEVLVVAIDVVRCLLSFQADQLRGLQNAREALVRTSERGAWIFTFGTLARVAVMLAALGREQVAAQLQAFTRSPPGLATNDDGDPAADIVFVHLTDDELHRCRATGTNLALVDAVALAMAELDRLISDLQQSPE